MNVSKMKKADLLRELHTVYQLLETVGDQAMSKKPDIFNFSDTAVYQFARRKAVFGHRDWLVWKLVDGSYRTAQLGPAVLEQALLECAINEAGKLIIVCVQANVGHYLNVGRGLATVWLKNMHNGFFKYT